jgi:uncharacterized membrane protein YjfL (UPF0719 family)
MAPTDATPSDPLPLLRGVGGLALLGTALTIGQHLASLAPATPEAWAWGAAHLAGGLASLALGHRILTRAYPLADLAAQGATNPAAALQLTAHRLAAAAIAGACWGGIDGPSLLVSAAFTVLAWLSVVLICAGHRAVTRYADHEEIAAGNVAAALASAGLHLAVALVVMRALQGPFLGWGPSLTAYGLALAWVLLLWPLRQLLVARLLLRRSPRDMDLAVAGRQDVWVGAVEALGYLLTALTVASAW